MENIFYNENGNSYYILFGGKSKRSFLCNLKENINAKYVICAILEDSSWWQGNYFNDFEEAYQHWKSRE